MRPTALWLAGWAVALLPLFAPVLSCARADDPDASVLFEEAAKRIRQDEYAQARQILVRIASRYRGRSECAEARLQLAELLEREGRDRQAFRLYQRVADEYPGFRSRANDRQLDLCIRLMSPESPDGQEPGRRSHALVKDMLEKVYLNDPQAPRAARVQYHLGLYYEQAGQPEVATVYYRYAAAAESEGEWHDRAFFGEARILYWDARSNREGLDRARSARRVLEAYLAHGSSGCYRGTAERMLEETIRRIHALAFQCAQFYDRDRFSVNTRLTAFRTFLTEHPDSRQADYAKRRVRELLNRLVQAQAVLPAG
ncbi:MAG: tetratricopeptide repeat protein [Verrucomicrobia bacterium]|nr:tetratricopeptide repeat protein [Kiritimatiellia bacterium]MCP5488149.1 tetratricopeptide repeat protein [Verrucomicrobiota bacterium]